MGSEADKARSSRLRSLLLKARNRPNMFSRFLRSARRSSLNGERETSSDGFERRACPTVMSEPRHILRIVDAARSATLQRR